MAYHPPQRNGTSPVITMLAVLGSIFAIFIIGWLLAVMFVIVARSI